MCLSSTSQTHLPGGRVMGSKKSPGSASELQGGPQWLVTRAAPCRVAEAVLVVHGQLNSKLVPPTL